MAGRGPAPKATRRRANPPARGEWTAAPGIGWQHGPIPPPPARLVKASRDAWQTWFTAWFASHWGVEDVPLLRQVIALFDTVQRGGATGSERSELRQMLDSFGVTKKGQQDRHWSWTPPKPEQATDPVVAPLKPSPYGHLRAVGSDER